MVVRAEQLLNAAETTLNGAINNSTTSITLTDGSVYPSIGDWRIIIDDEIMLITARSANVIIVTRGAESTVAASHDDEDTVITIITQSGMDQFVKDFIDPQAFDRTGVHRLLDIDGNTLTKSDFTELNIGTGTVSDDTWGGISHAMQFGATTNLRVIHKSVPSTPYVLEAHILAGIGSNNGTAENVNGIGWREASSGKLSFLGYHLAFSTLAVYVDSVTAKGSAPANLTGPDAPARGDYWLRVEDDGTNLTYKISGDGFNYFQVHTELRTFHFNVAPDQLCWICDNQGTDGEYMHLLSWIES